MAFNLGFFSFPLPGDSFPPAPIPACIYTIPFPRGIFLHEYVCLPITFLLYPLFIPVTL